MQIEQEIVVDEDVARAEEERRRTQMAALAGALKGLRDEAIKGRASSGIEDEWLEDEEYFEGIDDANRGERKIKPSSPDGRVRVERTRERKTSRSTVFVNITRPYVNAASAKVADMLFPTDDRNYAIRPTPIPDMIQVEEDSSPAFGQGGQPIMKAPVDQTGRPVMLPNGQPAMQQATNADMAREVMKRAKLAAEKAEKQIDDWLVQCGYHGEGRQVIEDSARLGSGVIKGPFPESTRRRAVVQALEGTGITIQDEIAPKSRRIDVWNLYPDPSCGESIHNGKYVWERDTINARQLGELKRDPSYDKDAIDRVLDEGPKSILTGESRRNKGERPNDKELYEIWYYTGYLSKKDLETAGYEFDKQPEEGLMEMAETQECGCDDEQHPAIAVMVNDVIVKATLQPLDSGEFPYDVMPWQRRAGHWAGIGVARQMRTSQDGVNAATRNMMDNAGVSGAPVLIIDRSKVVPADGNWTVGPHKVYYTTDNYDGGNIRDAFTWILAPSMQVELMNIIQFWMQRAEDETGLPMLLQGQLGKAPDTVGGMTMLNNNASSVLRRIARVFDDQITEPHIGRYYEWLLMYGDDDSMKGDYTIDARGSSALIERDMQSQVLLQMLNAAVNPAFGLDPEMVMQEFLKAQRFDADKLKLSDEKKQQMAQRQPPPDPRIQVAQLNAQARGQEKQLEAQGEQQALQMKLAFEAQQAELDRALKQWEKSIEAQIAQAQLSGEQAMNADDLKVALAKESAKLKTQVALAMQASRAPQVATPSVEPAGRAPNGQAFQR